MFTETIVLLVDVGFFGRFRGGAAAAGFLWVTVVRGWRCCNFRRLFAFALLWWGFLMVPLLGSKTSKVFLKKGCGGGAHADGCVGGSWFGDCVGVQ